MSFHLWLLFLVTELVLCLTPGPAVLFVVSQGLRYGARRSLWANLGILSGNAVYFALSALGLGTILLASHELFRFIRYAGAAYLIYLGIASIVRGHVAFAADTAAGAERVSGLRLLGRGFTLQAANPKALLFFAALLPQFIRPEASVPLQVAILGVTSTVAEFFVLAGYGVAAGWATRFARHPRFARSMGTASGLLLAGAGTGLALMQER